MTVTIAGDAPPEKLRQVVQRGTDRSVVFDIASPTESRSPSDVITV